MGLTALQAQGGLGTETAEYRGATTAAGFGHPHAEFAALQTGCGVFDLGYRAKLSITGGDRIRWLNGMVTNNVRDLAAGNGVYAFLLNPQGHILGDLSGFNRGESILVDTDRSQVEKMLATFDHYIIMDDVEVKDVSENLTAIGIAGPKSEDVLRAAGFEVRESGALHLQSVSWKGVDCTLVRSEQEPFPAHEIWIEPASVRQLWDALVTAGATGVGSEALEMHRIVSGVPRYGVDIRERDLPQETEQARALNFNKGCYIGQEIVERIRSRGAVHRKFSGLVADQAVSAGSKISVGEKEVGEITSATTVRMGNAELHVALGYIRREFGAPGREVTIGSTKARVVQTPISEKILIQEASSLQQHSA